mmetsp:Transcript_137322/g.342402  ORF Transcript_137322/g.342402 Transcript_137322/m.342402 type:complete len:553 (-) Transcript_137322:40-1698(-)
MDPDEKLRKRVGWLNTRGGFADGLLYEKVAAAAMGLEVTKVMRVLKDVEEKKDQVKDPTAYVTNALRKAGGGQAAPLPQGVAGSGWETSAAQGWTDLTAPLATGHMPPIGAAPGDGCGWGTPLEGYDEDQALRKKIGWLNSAGGFEGQINYAKIFEAAKGLEYSRVMKFLAQLEEKRGEVKDPTAWVCNALRKAGGGAYSPLPQPPAEYGGYGQSYSTSTSAMGTPSAFVNADEKLRKRVTWLNSQGGFAGALDHDKVAAAARGLEVTMVMKVLKDLEENKDKVKDPTAYSAAALRKMGGGSFYGGSLGGPGPLAQAAAAVNFAPPGIDCSSQGGGSGGYPAWTAEDAAVEDEKLRKKVGWLNKAGGFDGAINYSKIIEAARGLEYSEVMHYLKQLEERPRGTINDPTAWVCSALRKAGGNPAYGRVYDGNAAGGCLPPPPPSGYNFGGGESYGSGYASPVSMDVDADQKLRKRIRWLNNEGGFDNLINYQKVADASVGVDVHSVMEVLKDLEENKEKVKDPTAYAAAALRKRGPAGRGALGIRRTIMKKKT